MKNNNKTLHQSRLYQQKVSENARKNKVKSQYIPQRRNLQSNANKKMASELLSLHLSPAKLVFYITFFALIRHASSQVMQVNEDKSELIGNCSDIEYDCSCCNDFEQEEMDPSRNRQAIKQDFNHEEVECCSICCSLEVSEPMPEPVPVPLPVPVPFSTVNETNSTSDNTTAPMEEVQSSSPNTASSPESGDDSKKGLYGLFGLLAIIPSSLCCCFAALVVIRRLCASASLDAPVTGMTLPMYALTQQLHLVNTPLHQSTFDSSVIFDGPRTNMLQV